MVAVRMVEGRIVTVITVILSELLDRPVDELEHHSRSSALPPLPGLVAVRPHLRLLTLSPSLGPQKVQVGHQPGLVGLLGQNTGGQPASETNTRSDLISLSHGQSRPVCQHSPSPRLSEVSLEVILEVALIAEFLRADLALDDQTSLRAALARLESHDI